MIIVWLIGLGWVVVVVVEGTRCVRVCTERGGIFFFSDLLAITESDDLAR